LPGWGGAATTALGCASWIGSTRRGRRRRLGGGGGVRREARASGGKMENAGRTHGERGRTRGRSGEKKVDQVFVSTSFFLGVEIVEGGWWARWVGGWVDVGWVKKQFIFGRNAPQIAISMVVPPFFGHHATLRVDPA
jgi:hypothetical protein